MFAKIDLFFNVIKLYHLQVMSAIMFKLRFFGKFECHLIVTHILIKFCYFCFFFQILEAADKIQALDMKKHALRLMVHNFQNVSLHIMVSGIMCLYFDTLIYTLNTVIRVYLVKFCY